MHFSPSPVTLPSWGDLRTITTEYTNDQLQQILRFSVDVTSFMNDPLNENYNVRSMWRHFRTTPTAKIGTSGVRVSFSELRWNFPLRHQHSDFKVNWRINRIFFRLVVGLTGRKLIGWDNNRSPLTFNDEAVLRNKTLSEKGKSW